MLCSKVQFLQTMSLHLHFLPPLARHWGKFLIRYIVFSVWCFCLLITIFYFEAITSFYHLSVSEKGTRNESLTQQFTCRLVNSHRLIIFPSNRFVINIISSSTWKKNVACIAFFFKKKKKITFFFLFKTNYYEASLISNQFN